MTISKYALLAVVAVTLTGCVEDNYYATQTPHPRGYYNSAPPSTHARYDAVSTPVPPRNNYPQSAVTRQVPAPGYRPVPTPTRQSEPLSDYSGPVAAPGY